MHAQPHTRIGFFLLIWLLPVLLFAQAADDCLMCHADTELEAEDGSIVGVDEEYFGDSVHGFFDCVDCHDQPGADWEDLPHFSVYHPVDCSICHEDAAGSYDGSFHGRALAGGEAEAPECSQCHGSSQDPHRIQSVGSGVAENACRVCHRKETQAYRGSVHQVAHDQGKPSPGCTSCHPTHGAELPPSAGAVNNLCLSCHKDAMRSVMIGGHPFGETEQGAINCASCHDVHATHIPEVDSGTLQACVECHPGYESQFAGSVHEEMLESEKMNCLSCHKTHQVADTEEETEFGCGQCHEDAEAVYRTSAHRMARLHGDVVAAECADCHGGHHILPASDPESLVHHDNIPGMCGECHSDNTVITSDYVRLPISLPSYERSVHGMGLQAGKPTAVCTDCHGSHNLQSANVSTSMVARQNLTQTCGQCHEEEAAIFGESVHGRAVQHGIKDSPDCTGCHEEHLILPISDPDSPVNPSNISHHACRECHEDPELAARYGLPTEVVESYEDSYHGWALSRGGGMVASCEDCHGTHNIKSIHDPDSRIHPDNVVAMCGECHDQSNPTFAASYSHISARGAWGIHDYARVIYIILIAIVLGGMAFHNGLILFKTIRHHKRHHEAQEAVLRMTKNEIWQHILLAFTFIVLAITGFALRYPDAWWVNILTSLGMTETVRAFTHRLMAGMMIATSFYHIAYLWFTARGRELMKAMIPHPKDAGRALGTMLYYMGLKTRQPNHGMFDYTQKAEYWALVWGTIVMALTGFILMYPDLVTAFLPAWVIRVSETIHFYEAILAVGAIIIWHFFFTIFIPREYPMSWIWITGRMPKHEWDHHHSDETNELGREPKILPPTGKYADGEKDDPLLPH
ncbi:cytochrome c3 family protein [bacterium]|nr:cytochrome c3 family protein [bacterium]